MDVALLTLLVAAPFALATAYFDLKTMEIPHWLAISTAIAFIALVFATLPMEAALWRVGIGFGLLIAFFVMHMFGLIAGGDAKAIATFAMLVKPVDASFVLVLLAASGLLMMLGILLLRRTALAGGEWKVWSTNKFPYGVALCATTLTYLGLAAALL